MGCEPSVEEVDVDEALKNIPAGGCLRRVWYECSELRRRSDTDGVVDGTLPWSEYLWRRVCCRPNFLDPRKVCYRILYCERGDCFHVRLILDAEQWNDVVVKHLTLTEDDIDGLLEMSEDHYDYDEEEDEYE